MSNYIRRFAAPLALSLALVAGACGDDRADDELSQDSALNRDLQLATGDTAVQPQLEDVPAAEPAPAPTTPTATPPRATTPTRTPTRPAPRPTTPAPESKVCTNTNKVGDRFTARVTETITGSNGATIPAGATVVLELTRLKKSENARDNVEMGFAVRSISVEGRSYAVDADVTNATVDRVRANDTRSDAKKVIGGAVIGAVLGQVIGKDAKGTVIGAAAGAAAGTAAAAATGDVDGCVNDGGRITIRLNEAATVQAS